MVSRGRKYIISWSVDHMLPIILSLFLLCSSLHNCSAKDTIPFNGSISDKREETLVSTGEIFELGFFTPNENSSTYRRYVGIWYYNIAPRTVVWVANRDHPLSDGKGSFAITEDGNLQVLDGEENSFWSTAVEISSFNNTSAMLDDSGNLILSDNISGETLWESFGSPTDTFLPGMKMDEGLNLTSWKSSDDPTRGDFVFQRYQSSLDQFVIWKNTLTSYWMSEPGQMPSAIANLLSNSNSTNSVSLARVVSKSVKAGAGATVTGNPIKNTFPAVTSCGRGSPYGGSCLPTRNSSSYNHTRLVMSFNGEIQYLRISSGDKNWSLIWFEPYKCGELNACGNFGSCTINNSVRCKCLPGFEPRFLENWGSGYFLNGCKRKTPICGNNTLSVTFMTLKNMKVGEPEGRIHARNETNCKTSYCLSDCDCQAYSYDDSNGTCLIWTKELKNLQEVYPDGISLKLKSLSDEDLKLPSPKKKPLTTIIAITITTVIVLIAASCAIVYYSYLRGIKVAKRRENGEDFQQNEELHFYDTERRVKNLIDSDHFREEDKKDIDVPFFNLESILNATDNFSNANKLGKGGFGPVYKGKFPRGREIAVKRLSSVSGQGLEEFKNEVVLISKLQHRNLVRLLGYCIKGEEKILLYEYMPNKSLDFFIFDRTSSVLLDWELRFNIILGIARGLLYLHEDSRLRIIHRDLKTSNILLDEEMSPKISDFGLARIFGGKQTEGNTNKVVGTYGYMSPEYALDGFFSVKSDVFSFGVVILEIISGIRNTRFYQSEQALSLLGYAWRLWNEDKALDLMDQTVCETCNTNEFLKCMNVGLLCVQDDPSDRPTMSNVVAVLVSETATLPTPKQPAFLSRRDPSNTASSSSKPEACSIYELTTTDEQGR